MVSFQALTAVLAFAVNISAAPTEIVERQTGISGILTSYAASQFKSVFGTVAQCCSDGSYDEVNSNHVPCYAAQSNKTADIKLPWQLCYSPGSDETKPGSLWGERDVKVAQCITDLHYKQRDVCISVKGSSCDDGYVDAGGRMQNARISFIGSNGESKPLTGDQSISIQHGIAALEGQKLVTSKIDGFNIGPVFSVLSPVNGVEEVNLSFRYIGEDAC